MANLANNITAVSSFTMVILATDNYLLSGYHDSICCQGYRCPNGYYKYICWHAYPKPLVSINSGEWTRVMGLFCSANFIRMMKSRKIRWVGHVARVEEKRNATAFGWEI